MRVQVSPRAQKRENEMTTPDEDAQHYINPKALVLESFRLLAIFVVNYQMDTFLYLKHYVLNKSIAVL